ncbi:hypothetical protein EVAR_9909_1 [Eumeta japonica]|uniref:Uncharacterized protein n=1 Tax=Eumeta variegata TaxID=151549 RepID=A0A4C1TQF1_EUMVA|nr:hypothetical protein EVAR_9909_1 [Eumeta japonica]
MHLAETSYVISKRFHLKRDGVLTPVRTYLPHVRTYAPDSNCGALRNGIMNEERMVPHPAQAQAAQVRRGTCLGDTDKQTILRLLFYLPG